MAEASGARVGDLLRSWRRRRQLSQLELSARTGVSTRHLSYVETGRSRPTRAMIERLAGELEIPLRERNELLLAAGLAPAYPERGLDAPELLAVSGALQSILDAHLPYPALLLDRWWNVVDRNAATDVLLAGCAEHLLEPPVNAVLLTLHPDGLAPRIANLGQWRAHLLSQVRSRAARTGDARLTQLADQAAALPGEGTGRAARTDVVLPLELTIGDDVLRFFSLSTAVESATDVTVDEVRLEAFYPADDATRAVVTAATGARADRR